MLINYGKATSNPGLKSYAILSIASVISLTCTHGCARENVSPPHNQGQSKQMINLGSLELQQPKNGPESAQETTGVNSSGTTPPKQTPLGKKVIITGFADFGPSGNPCIPNPTGAVLPFLREELNKQCPGNGVDIALHGPLDVRPGIIETVPGFSNADLVISMGCDAKANEIRVEQGATNCFIDYENGLKAYFCDDQLDYKCYLKCRDLPPGIAGKYSDCKVVLGKHGAIGLYVCNDTLFRTLATKKDGIFIHIPPGGDEATLKKYAAALATVMCKIITNRFPEKTMPSPEH